MYDFPKLIELKVLHQSVTKLKMQKNSKFSIKFRIKFSYRKIDIKVF